jgi:hypothetical protein
VAGGGLLNGEPQETKHTFCVDELWAGQDLGELLLNRQDRGIRPGASRKTQRLKPMI